MLIWLLLEPIKEILFSQNLAYFFQKRRVAKHNLNQKYGLTQRCIYPASQLAHLLPCSQPWRVFFFKRKSRLCHFKSHKVQNNSTEALWTQSEDYWNGVWSCCYCKFSLLTCEWIIIMFTMRGSYVLFVYLSGKTKRAHGCFFSPQ